MTNPLALIIDDEADIRELLDLTLSRMDVDCHLAANCKQAKALLDRHSFDLCLTDMRLPDGSGIEIVKFINEHHPSTPVAVITAHGNTDAAIESLKSGAFDFVSKPVDLSDLRNLVTTALKLRPAQTAKTMISIMHGQSAIVQRTKATIAKLARSQAPVHITGESGTGKELAAKMIHEQGPRHDQPFIAINCGAIPTELMESEFFGHVKGSFTGAHADKDGLLVSAHRGTILLDEIADLPAHMQVKLLRVIQERTVRPIGASAEQAIDVRLISATHKDLGELVRDGQFRQDLYYRINVVQLCMPALRERGHDINDLTDFFIERIAADWNIDTPQIDSRARDALMQYSFPGNVRELRNVLERSITLCEDNRITQADLQLSTTSTLPTEAATDRGDASLPDFIEQIERKAITDALESCRYNKTMAAKQLGITFRALRYRLKKLGME